MKSLKEILDTLEPLSDGPGWRGEIPENWLQGRTAYGGLSAAIALHCAMQSDEDLPPLRSAQVSFIGPLSGPILVTAHRLRRGKNAAFIQVDVESEAGLGLRCTFVFMRAIDSEVDYQTTTLPAFPQPTADDTTFKGNPHVAFTRNFEFLDRREGPNLLPAEWLRWTRLNEREGLDPMVELIAVGDCLPPAALRLLGRNVPMSSLTWILNILGPAPTTEDGWWLLRSNADYARTGSSSQQMGIWNSRGEMVAEQMQSVALFA
ncbi:thioesterase family protein [Sphingomonas sp. SUN019]|uniref:thioesterase family protein n=1 Tax=Sphingomonas sp. SUN019 TaxID=2937788 RepID=UPI0021641B00|nr:thioesterase family protein [Sphingomonas sp. SUN019]UVO49415.1 thioesterase family protein [Sphingomonas sp. SUN019]